MQLLSLPTVTATPFQTNGTSTPPPASIFIGIGRLFPLIRGIYAVCVYTVFCFLVLHPVGNIVEFLLGAGLAHFVEWHSGMLAPYGGSEKLRAADRAAKEKRLGLHANAPTAPALSKSISGATNCTERTFEGSVIRVWSGDRISILTKDGKERRVQLSSTRGPKCVHPLLMLTGLHVDHKVDRLSDPKQAYYAHEAREFLRKKLIGKHVRIQVDFIRPREGEYEERESATVRVGNQGVSVDESLALLALSFDVSTVT